MKFSIRKKEHWTVEPQAALKWNKGYGYDIEEDLLYVWSTQDLHFFNLKNLQLRTKITNLTRK